MASTNDNSNGDTNSSNKDNQETEVITKKDDVNNKTGNDNDTSAFYDAENDQHLTYNLIEKNNDGDGNSHTKNMNTTCTIIEETSSSSSLLRTEHLVNDSNHDKSVDKEVTNDNSTDSDSFSIIDNDNVTSTPSASSSSMEKKITQQEKRKSLTFNTNNCLDENLVKMICKTVETTLKTYLSKYNLKKNKRKTRNRHGKRKMSSNNDRKKTMIKDGNKHDTTFTTKFNQKHVFCTKKPEQFNLKTDIFGIKNDMMDITQNNIMNKNDNFDENAPKRLSPQLISDIVDSALNDGPKNTINNNKQQSSINQGLSYNNYDGNSGKPCNDKLNFPQVKNSDSQTALNSQVPLITNQPPWWFRDNILLATEFLNKGTASDKFHPCYLENENMKTKLYETMRTQSLTFMTPYENKSFEELRYEDYILQEMGAYIRHRINPGNFRGATGTGLQETCQDRLVYAPTFDQEEFIKKNGDIERNQVIYHCISCMKDCKHLSFEELRLDHYTKNNTNQEIAARAHESTANHNLDRSLAETALKNYQLLEKKSSKTLDSNECKPTTSKDSKTQDSIFKNSLFNDSETIAKSIFSKSNNPFFNPFTHCRAPVFKLENPNFDTKPKESTNKSVFDVTPAKVNFVFNPDTSPLKKSSVKPKSNLQHAMESKILSKSNDTSKFMFGWSCKPFNFSKPSEPILNFNNTSQQQKFGKTTNIFGAKPKTKGSVFCNDIFQDTIAKLLNENNDQTNEDCVMNDSKIDNGVMSSHASTSSMDTQVIEKQMDTVLEETSQLLHNIDVLTSENTFEIAKITQTELKLEGNIKEHEINYKKKIRNINKHASDKSKIVHKSISGLNGRRVFEKDQSNSTERYFKPLGTNDTKNLFSSSATKNDTKPDSTYFSYSISPKNNKNNDENTQSKQSQLFFCKTAPVSSPLKTSEPSTSTFNFSSQNANKQNDTKIVNSNASNIIFGESNKTENAKNNAFFSKPSTSTFNFSFQNANKQNDTKIVNSNASNIIFRESNKTENVKNVAFFPKSFEPFDLKDVYSSATKTSNVKSSPIDIKQPKPFWAVNKPSVDSNSQTKQLSEENQSIAGSSIFNLQTQPDFEFDKPIVGDLFSTTLASYIHRLGANSHKTDNKPINISKNVFPKSVFGTTQPSSSIFKQNPHKNISRQTPESDFDLLLKSAQVNTIKNSSLTTNRMQNSSNNESTSNLNSIATETRPWTSIFCSSNNESTSNLNSTTTQTHPPTFSFAPKPSKNTKPINDDNNSKIDIGLSLSNMPEFNASVCLPNAGQSLEDTSLNTSSYLDIASSNNQTYERPFLIPNQPTEMPITFKDVIIPTSQIKPNYSIDNLDPSFGQSSRVFNCIDEAKVHQVPSNIARESRESGALRLGVDYGIPSLTDDSSEDDDAEVVQTRNSLSADFLRDLRRSVIDDTDDPSNAYENDAEVVQTRNPLSADFLRDLRRSVIDDTDDPSNAYENDAEVVQTRNPLSADFLRDLRRSVIDDTDDPSNAYENDAEVVQTRNPLSADFLRDLRRSVINDTDDPSNAYENDAEVVQTRNPLSADFLRDLRRSIIGDIDDTSNAYEPIATNIVNEMTDNRSLNSANDDLGFTRFDSNSFDVMINSDSTSNMDNGKPLQVKRFNCNERNQVSNGIDDAHAKYIFGQTTVKCGFKIELRLRNIKKSPKLYIGLTTCNPESLTDFDMPYQPGDLCERTESWTLKDVSQALMGAKKITMQFESQGVANIKCDNKTIQQLFIDYSVSTWPFFVIQSGHVEIDFLTDDIQDSVARSAVEVNTSDCVICYENPVDTVLYRCGHSCLCLKCGKLMLKNLGICPICRDLILDVIKIYTA